MTFTVTSCTAPGLDQDQFTTICMLLPEALVVLEKSKGPALVSLAAPQLTPAGPYPGFGKRIFLERLADHWKLAT